MNFTATSKYVKKEKTKHIEEVIDVVGDFGPPKPSEQSQYIDNESFGVAFDPTNVQSMMMQQQQNQGNFFIIIIVLLTIYNSNFNFILKVKMITIVNNSLQQKL